ncbi:hypothetical protein VFPFJ_09236 [Purpureocillium lilacinum]|nr:hypothetical protein VFPFJ_09236 [Purpureocillium lilacinum]OAQ80782.1 hypothetical protein VFPFJ_09236 [Purpureocillium lilacinum]
MPRRATSLLAIRDGRASRAGQGRMGQDRTGQDMAGQCTHIAVGGRDSHCVRDDDPSTTLRGPGIIAPSAIAVAIAIDIAIAIALALAIATAPPRDGVERRLATDDAAALAPAEPGTEQTNAARPLALT